jgi:hypothetical protein
MESRFRRDFNIVFKEVKNTLKTLGFEIKYQDTNTGLITAKSPSSFLSWGENIEVKVDRDGNNSTKVNVRSEATAQLFDWGVNKKNEAAIIERLNTKFG